MYAIKVVHKLALLVLLVAAGDMPHQKNSNGLAKAVCNSTITPL